MNVFPIVHSNFLGKKNIFIVIISITVFDVPIWCLIHFLQNCNVYFPFMKMNDFFFIFYFNDSQNIVILCSSNTYILHFEFLWNSSKILKKCFLKCFQFTYMKYQFLKIFLVFNPLSLFLKQPKLIFIIKHSY